MKFRPCPRYDSFVGTPQTCRGPPPSAPHPPPFNHPAPGPVPGASFNKEQNHG